jgi:glucose/arabinose dehydrogenase
MARGIVLFGIALTMVVAACGDDGSGTTVVSSAPSTLAPTVTPEPTSDTAPPATTVPPGTSTTGSEPPPTTTPIPPADELRVRLEEVVRVDQPVLVTAPVGDPRLYVVDQPGRIWVVTDGEREVLLDIRDRVGFGGERGLLSMAFHPDHATNGLFYVNYTDTSGDTIIAEFQMPEPGRADPGSHRQVLRVGQPASNHNGGMIIFDTAGYLLIGMGDGGGANNEFRTARNPRRLNGAMLRIAVGPGFPEPYGVPADNPYVGTEDGRDEVWAIGLRNPWRFAIDGERLYVADVGQGRVEEVNVAPSTVAGLDFGWSIMEGDECFRRSSCDASGFVAPVYTYGHGQGCSVTGGVVYRGSALPEIDGHYFFADYCSGWVRSIVVDDNGSLIEELDWPGLDVRLPGGFGTDGFGEMYIASQRGPIYKVVRGEDG